ncbi:hypothetical protein GE061_004060, partial [Apolygus lucorum]
MDMTDGRNEIIISRDAGFLEEEDSSKTHQTILNCDTKFIKNQNQNSDHEIEISPSPSVAVVSTPESEASDHDLFGSQSDSENSDASFDESIKTQSEHDVTGNSGDFAGFETEEYLPAKEDLAGDDAVGVRQPKPKKFVDHITYLGIDHKKKKQGPPKGKARSPDTNLDSGEQRDMSRCPQ